ncbi:hypothetical protein AB0D57_15065 [Streptomyces sp. NPDC048275]
MAPTDPVGVTAFCDLYRQNGTGEGAFAARVKIVGGRQGRKGIF